MTADVSLATTRLSMLKLVRSCAQHVLGTPSTIAVEHSLLGIVLPALRGLNRRRAAQHVLHAPMAHEQGTQEKAAFCARLADLWLLQASANANNAP